MNENHVDRICMSYGQSFVGHGIQTVLGRPLDRLLIK